MANRYFKSVVRSLEGEPIKLFGKVVTGSTGAIASQRTKGFSVAKTAGKTGRYTVTLEDKYNALLGCSVALEGDADSAYPIANGAVSFIRGVAVGAETPILEIQFARADTMADAEVEDAAEFFIELTLKNTTAY